MTVSKEVVIPLTDLRYLTVECGKCHTQTSLDLAGLADVMMCAVCNEEFDPLAVNSYILAFKKAFEDSPKMKRLPGSSLKVSDPRNS